MNIPSAMKTNLLTIAVLGSLAGLCSLCTRTSDPALREQFLVPPLEYRMNQNLHEFPLDDKGQDSLIRAYLDNGYGGFSINVPFGHYLTEEGMNATLRFARKARAAGMELWLYDEHGYPSGNAGDLVINTNPDWEAMGLFFDDTIVKEGPLEFMLPRGRQEMVAAFPVVGGRVDYSRKTDLMGRVEGPLLQWEVPKGEWNVFAVSKDYLYDGFQISQKPGSGAGPHYPSLLIPEVTETFIRITHETYARYMGKDLGKYFTSTFTDEPSTMALPFEWYAWSVIPWHEVLSDRMFEHFGYRPEEKLVELFADEGPAGQQVRYQYFFTVAELITQNYFRPIREWCEEHHFRSGGHLLLEESMMAHVPLYGNIMQVFREMHAPGIDILSCYPKFMPVHSPKLASSTAELTGNQLVMSEPCPVMELFTLGDEPPAEAVRGHLNMLLAGGVTDFNNYLRLTRSDQAERIEINTYVGRINLLLRGGYTRSDIAVVYPIESLWTVFTPRPMKVVDGLFRDPDVPGWDTVAGGAQRAIQIEQAFRNVSRFMFANRWEYNYIDARAIMESKVENGVLVHGQLRWKVIVLPAVTTLPEDAWARLGDFAASGGRIIALEMMPENSDRHFPDPDVRNGAAKLFTENKHAVFLEAWSHARLEEILEGWLSKAVSLEDESLDLRIAHKNVHGKEVFFIINDSPVTTTTTITLKARGRLEEWDPATGEIRRVSRKTEIELKPYHGKIYRSM